jgi:hypothetical protein
MESAIPPHLTVARSRPTRVPDDFVPAYPSFVARIPESVDQVVMAYLGAQDGEPGIDAGPDGPRHHDRARQDAPAIWSSRRTGTTSRRSTAGSRGVVSRGSRGRAAGGSR